MTKTDVIFYKLYVKRDLMEERGRSIESLKSNMNTLDEELVAQLLDHTDEEGSGFEEKVKDKVMSESKEFLEEIIRYPKDGQRTKDFFVFEEELFNYLTNTFILSHDGFETKVIIKKADDKAVLKKLNYRTEKIVDMYQDIFALKIEDEESVVRLQPNFAKEKGFKHKIVYQEFTGKILAINGDKKKLYTLVKVDGDIFLKVLVCKNNDFDFVC